MKIAFHLARGKNFMHWQIKHDDGSITYINPEHSDLILHNCTLKNQKSASARIYNGGEKNRCAWVEFDSFEIIPSAGYTSAVQVRFNPRICPTWIVQGKGEQDGRTFASIRSNNSKLYI
jgi:hypothetical protein